MRKEITFVRVANSPRLLLLTFVVVLFSASLLYSLFEHDSFLDSMYWCVVTATTLGYGDLSPKTLPGKTLTAVLIASTVFIFIPTITANIASKLIVDRDVFTHEEQEDMKNSLHEILRRLDGNKPA